MLRKQCKNAVVCFTMIPRRNIHITYFVINCIIRIHSFVRSYSVIEVGTNYNSFDRHCGFYCFGVNFTFKEITNNLDLMSHGDDVNKFLVILVLACGFVSAKIREETIKLGTFQFTYIYIIFNSLEAVKSYR